MVKLLDKKTLEEILVFPSLKKISNLGFGYLTLTPDFKVLFFYEGDYTIKFEDFTSRYLIVAESKEQIRNLDSKTFSNESLWEMKWVVYTLAKIGDFYADKSMNILDTNFYADKAINILDGLPETQSQLHTYKPIYILKR